MKVPLLDLQAQYATIRADVDAALRRVCESQQFILGKAVEAFESQMAAYCRSRHAIGVSSGTDALLCALMAVGVRPGDEVIVPPFTFFATAGVVARLGARPVFVDIEPQTFNLDPGRLEAAITPRTRAILPVDLFGQIAEMQAIGEIAARRGIPVIEDAAQAIGAEHRGRRAGEYAALTCLSFFPTKNLGGFGDGGMILANDDALAGRCRMLRVHGAQREYFHDEVGGNFRLDALQAAVLAAKLPHLDAWIDARRQRAATYDELLADAGVGRPVAWPHNRHVYHQYTIRVPEGRRDALAARLKQAEIGCKVYYPLALHEQGCFRSLGHRRGDFPVAERAASEVLSLPMYPELTREMQAHVAATIAGFMRGG
ncbi:MAG: DegT/DnrJ/EryC1/StrS family aminotransferase [Phycisphaerae bacterium]|nr:DegT/DnrJ/EryC1/StrS family aminotransferase [Phycisphaerae bacterium]